MDISKLDLFFAAANSESFTQAAEKCNVAQTTMSKYIAQLEEELGVKLFYRTTRECSLTEAGHTFYNGAKEIITMYMDRYGFDYKRANATKAWFNYELLD